MEPISIALGLAQATGLADKIGGLIGGKNGQAVADRVVDVAKLVTGMHDGRSALEEVQADPGAKVRLEEALIDREVELQKIAQEDRADARSLQFAMDLNLITFQLLNNVRLVVLVEHLRL